MRRFGILLVVMVLVSGCQKIAPLDYSKETVLRRGGSETITLDAMAGLRDVVITCNGTEVLDAFVVIGPGNKVADAVANALEPNESIYHKKISGKSGTTRLDLPAHKELNIVLRNGGKADNKVTLRIEAKGK